MSPLSHRFPAIETLQQMMSRLADSSLTIDEASHLRSLIHQLMDELNAGESRASGTTERIVWPEEGHSNLSGPVSTLFESTESFRVEWRDVSPAGGSAQERETSGGSIPSAVARST